MCNQLKPNGWIRHNTMGRFTQWVRETIKRYWLKLKLSRFFLGVICLIIGFTSCFIWIKGTEWYVWMMEGRTITIKTIEKIDGSGVSALERVTSKANASGQPDALEEATASSSAERLADLIQKYESSGGKNDQKCERLGPNSHNSYGFSQWTGHNTCFASDEEARKYVIRWIEDKQAKGMTEPELLSLYSGGAYNN